MPKRVSFRAVGDIPYGSPVLCRGNSARVCAADIANGYALEARKLPFASPKGCFSDGEMAAIYTIDLPPDCNLQALADGPIRDPLKLFLPAGRVSEADYRERIRADFQRAGITE